MCNLSKKEFEVVYYKDDGRNSREYSHKYSESWEQTKDFCPHCGKQTVWVENSGGGDYYVGEEYLCLTCNHGFNLPHDPFDMTNDEQGKQRIANLKN